MELSIKERINLLSIIPKEGNIVTLKVLRKLQEDLGFSEEEIKEYKIVSEVGRVTWGAENGYMKDVEIGEKANDVIVLALSERNKQNKLSLDHIDLYEKFIEKAE